MSPSKLLEYARERALLGDHFSRNLVWAYDTLNSSSVARGDEDISVTAVSTPVFPKKLLLLIGVGLATLILYLYYFVGTSNITDVIGKTDLLIYSTAFISFTISVFFSSLTWKSLLKNLSVKVSLRQVLLFTWVGLFFDTTVPEPGWSGDISKAYMLARVSNEDSGKVAASVVSQKIIGMGITAFDLVLGLALLAHSYLLSESVLITVGTVLALTISSLAVVWYLSNRPKATHRLLNGLVNAAKFLRRGRWNPAKFRAEAEKFLDAFHRGVGTLNSNRAALIKPTMLYLASWIFDVTIVFLVFVSLGHAIPIDKVLIIYALTGTLQIMGVSFVGFTEVIVSGAYTVLGVETALSLSVTLLTRVVTLWFKMIASYAAFQWACVKIFSGSDKACTIP